MFVIKLWFSCYYARKRIFRSYKGSLFSKQQILYAPAVQAFDVMNQPVKAMSPVGTRHSIRMDEDPQSQKTLKRKQGSTLRSLKESFKFRGSVSLKKGPLAGQSAQSSPSRVRRDSNEPRKSKQRLSAQRLTLFKYENVRALSSSAPNAGRRDSESTASSNTTRSSDVTSVSSNRSCCSVKIKPTTLMARGCLEIYQIYTPSTGNAEKRQEMNYLSLGRKENIVHPILPKLQVTKVALTKTRYVIHFYNPDRFWEIEFLPGSDSANLSNVVDEFEAVMAKICDFSKPNEPRLAQKESLTSKIVDKSELNKVIVKSDSNEATKKAREEGEKLKNAQVSDDDDDDDLNYLLEENEESVTVLPIPETLAGESNSDENEVNEAFRKAMQNFTSPSTLRGSVSARFIEYSSKRFSSYQPPHNILEQSQALPRRSSYFGGSRATSLRSWVDDFESIHITKRASNKTVRS